MADEKKKSIPEREEDILAFWNEHKIFEKSLKKNSPQGEFVFYDGPPFATGLPHYGSLLSSIVKDVIPRYKTMRGYHVRRRWGWDCHGLPIENMVEKKLGLKTKKDIEAIGVETFNTACADEVLRFTHEWGVFVNRIGRWVEFESAYKTMDPTYIESVWWALKQAYEQGRLYEGRRVLLYCPHCETPLAKAEIAMDNSYKDITEETVIVKFKIREPGKHGLPKNISFLAWTTTPWTLPGNVALAIGEEISYALVGQGDEYFIVAKDLVKKIFHEEDIVEKTFLGKELVGIAYEPLYEISVVKATGKKAWYVAPADFVTTEDGTGVVHTAVIYGEDDYNLGLKLDLPMVPLLDSSGHFNQHAPELIRGEYFKKSEKTIKEDLDARGLLFAKSMYTHPYPHCYRCETPLIYNAISSWFINIQEIKQRMLELNRGINWIPEHLKYGRFGHIVEDAPDWTISRNRYWASPLPIWKCGQCSSIKLVGSLKELQEGMSISGKPFPYNGKGELDLHRPYVDDVQFACSCGGIMKRIPEVVDCWVESGSMPFAELHYPFENEELFKRRFPGDFISEYIAQTRTWFYYTHAVSTLLFNDLAFRNVLTTGNILATDGGKMSKSKGNYTDPFENINRYGADALRYYLMTSVVMQAEDVRFLDDELKEVHNRVMNILYNAFRFYEMYAAGAATVEASAASNHVLDRWILARLKQLMYEVTGYLDAYNTVKTSRAIREFITEFSTWYIRRSRERFKDAHDEADRTHALATTRHVLLQFSKMIAPLMPFVAEDIYQQVKETGGRESVHLEEWPAVEDWKEEKRILADMDEVRKIVSLGLEARSHAGIKVRQPLQKLQITDSKLRGQNELLDLIRDEVNVKEITFGETMMLDTALTQELREEGMVRELVRNIQEMRRDMELKPKNVIRCQVMGDVVIESAVSRLQKQLQKDVNARTITIGGKKVFKAEREIEIDGKKIWIGIT